MNDAEFLRWLPTDLPESVLRPGEVSRLTAIAERLEWRGIETCPKVSSFSSEPFLALRSNGERHIACHYGTFGVMSELKGFGWCSDWTHWQPLPQPPEQA